MPKVSVIIPVYGVEHYIERCARSLFEQTLKDIEFLFIDDCTPDASISIIQRVLEEYPSRKGQVRILKMEKNSGQAIVRNRGIKEATGEYTIHCDGDDYVSFEMYEQMYDKAKQESADIVICDITLTNGKQSCQKRSCFTTNKEFLIRDLCAMRTNWSLCNKLIRSELLHSGITLPHNNMGEDMAIVFQVALRANRFSYIPIGYYYYFSNPVSITRVKNDVSIWNRFLQVYSNSMVVLDVLKNNGLLDKYKWPLCVLKLNVKRQAYAVLDKKDYADRWKVVFHDLNYRIWFCRYISLRDKAKYLVSIIRARAWS